MTTLDVAVTADHIAAGVRDEEVLCPVARGVRDALRAAGWSLGMVVRVAGWISVRPWPGERPQLAKTPRLVRARIRRYDRGGQMRPFTFALELPDAQEAR